LTQFILEAILISLIGGVVGIISGICASYIMTYGINSYGISWPFVVSFEAVIISFSVAAFFGIVFGWYPARKAARLNPIDALRYE
ncbi:MAG: FtsX-like permease family protein, partial [Minisyncoccia bacterium]